MSLILDALKRAESERGGAQAITGLPELSPVSLARPASNLRWILMGSVVLIIASLALWRFFTSPVKPATVAVVAEAAAPIAEVPAPAKPRPQAARPAAPIIGAEEVSSFDDVTGPEESQQLETPLAPTPAPAPIAPVETQRPAVVEPATPAPVARNKTPVRLNDTPPAYRAAFPSFTVQVHSWDQLPSARFVRIDGYRYIEGEVLPGGPKLVEIIADGLILDWNGERVIYPLN